MAKFLAAGLASRLSLNVAGNSDVTLTQVQTSASVLEFTGALTGNINVVYPSALDATEVVLSNLTSGAFTLTVKVSGQTGFVVGQGKRARGYFNATDLVRITPDT